MNKKYNLIFLIVLLLLCSGCQEIKYELKIDNTLSEKIKIKDETNLTNCDADLGCLSSTSSYFQGMRYDVNGVADGIYSVTGNYADINEFVDNSIVFSKIFDDKVISIDGKKVKIDVSLSDYLNIMEQIKNVSVEISIYIPYKVSKHNATKVNNNTYTWKINNLEKANIKINFDLSKSYKYKNNSVTYIFISSLIVLILGIGIFLYIKNKKNNEI